MHAATLFPPDHNNMKPFAKKLAASGLFARARRLLEENEKDWNLPLTKLQKLMVGSYMILRDYSTGDFPPTFENETSTFDAEKDYYRTLTEKGKDIAALRTSDMRKPFWTAAATTRYLSDFIDIRNALARCNIHPPAHLLEVGCGSGWMSEFLTVAGFAVTATTIDPEADFFLTRRKNSLVEKTLPNQLEFAASPMEYVDQAVPNKGSFDAVFVYEALHHAHDWKKSIHAFSACLKPGGWCFIFNEPNLTHTFVSYRVAHLSNTHEIGINPSELKRECKRAGLPEIRILKNRWHCYYKPIWIAARKSET